MLRGIILSFILCLTAAPHAAEAKRITESGVREHIAVLASDDFEGRDPGTEGEYKTIEYISSQWGSAGLQAAGRDGSWFEHVPLISYQAQSTKLHFNKGKRNLRFSKGDIVLVGKTSLYNQGNVPVLYAASGLKADGGLIDNVKGKLIFLELWTRDGVTGKFRSPRARKRALIKAGALGVVYIFDDKQWPDVKPRFERKSIILKGHSAIADIEGAVSTEFLVGLVTAAELDWDKLDKDARHDDFVGIDLGVTADFDIKTDVQQIQSHNVIGKIAGKKTGSGAVMLMGHWDHLGICGKEGDEDRICNGAADNASGISVLIEVAKKLAKKKHDRDIYFLATTAEEKGLFGAYSYVRDPVFPLDDIVMLLNVDTVAIGPKDSEVAIIGERSDKFDNIISKISKKLRRKLNKSNEANAFIQRQDGWAFAQQGVPAYMIGGSFSDMDRLQKFLSGPYHGVDDELTDDMELGGATEDANLHVEMVRYFASKRKYKREQTGED